MEHIINSWKDAKKVNVYRGSPCGLYPVSKIDKGVNYFVLALEKLECETLYSCEGHFSKPKYIPQLYITFKAKRYAILCLKNMLFDIINLEHDNYKQYTLRIDFNNNKDKIQKLTYLADQWNKILGPIKYKEKKYERV
jgi:hypothetical protein